MNKIENKREKEKRIISLMISLYCHKKHGTTNELCDKCKALRDYAFMRSDKCPHMESKTFCSNCKTHCYKPSMRQSIREVMRFSGPRMIFYHPIILFKHILTSRKGR